jgi:hypothetical protein
MRIKSLDIGLESVSRLHVEDEVHLPDQPGLRPVFLPAPQLLDEILRRPSLDERLPQLLQPDTLDPNLLEPAVLSGVRIETRNRLTACARRAEGHNRRLLEKAASLLGTEVNMDEEVRRSLAALLRG